MKNQLTLPFQLEGNVANRETIRNLSTAVSNMYRISLSMIRIRPGFNARIKPEGVTDELWDQILMIPDLADAIFANNGPADPLIGDFYSVDQCFYPTDGERRTRALRHLIATGRDIYPNGEPVDSVVVILNPKTTTDLDRKIKIGTTQGKLALTTMQWAHYYLSLKTDFGLTNQEIGDKLHISRAKVDQYILATKLPKDVQDDIDAGTKNISTEIAARRKKKADEDDELHEMTPSEEAHARKKEKEYSLTGDEDDFINQDNTVKGVSSMGGPKEDTSSGAHVVGKDAIYRDKEDTAKWKQFINRYRVLDDECLNITEGDVDKAQIKLIERLKSEFVIQVK
jgi:hypothetical protein